MDEIVAKLETKIGPLAAWEWGALVGGGLLVFRLVSQGHKTTGVSTVTLTPNNQPNLPSSSGQDTAGSIISGLNTLGFAPGNFSFTLPNGTVVTWSNSGISTSPAPTSPGPTPSNPTTTPGIGISPQIGPYVYAIPTQPRGIPWPALRPGTFIQGAPPSRGGPIAPGTPNAAPGQGPLPPRIPPIPPAPAPGVGIGTPGPTPGGR